MPSPKNVVAWIVCLFAFGLCLHAQAPRFLKPDRLERPTVEKDGAVEWAEWPAPKCPSCKGTGKLKCVTCERYADEAKICADCGRTEKREAVCHTCAGKGTLPDPLDVALCNGCRGAGHVLCPGCGGGGVLRIGDSKRWSKCPSCRGDGFFECMVCEGKRTVGMAKLKPSLRDADAASLKKVLEVTDKTLQALAAFQPVGKKTRKEIKVLSKALKGAEKVYPTFKSSAKLVKQLMAWTYAGSSFQGQQEREVRSMSQIKDTHEYYLQHQKRMLELALKRAELQEQAGK